LARPVKIQTFFRGTKLRYFEVTSSPTTDAAGSPPVTISDGDGSGDERHDEEWHPEREQDAGTATPFRPAPPLTQTPRLALPEPSTVNPDLDTLNYFHHFITTTSLTLPSTGRLRPATHYWQTHVILQALRRSWLMCGVLAISACHLAAFADDLTVARIHRLRSTQFLLEFSAGWAEIIQRGSSVEAAGLAEEEKKLGGDIRCILQCARWALSESTPHHGISLELALPCQLQSIITTIRNFALASGNIRSDDSDPREENFGRAARISGTGSSQAAESTNAFVCSDKTPAALLDRLNALPSRMMEAFGKPESTQDVFAVLSAIVTLTECCHVSFAFDEVEATWLGMATWLIKVSDHFNHMVSRQNPAALVVLAHWAASLVMRAEHFGCWFLRGSAKTVILQIDEQLRAHSPAALSMIVGLSV
jgi:hypothetical protein